VLWDSSAELRATKPLKQQSHVETEHSEVQLQNGSDYKVVASYSGLYEESDVEHINIPHLPTHCAGGIAQV